MTRRGFGASGYSDLEEGVDSFGRDARAVMDALPLSQPVLVGPSSTRAKSSPFPATTSKIEAVSGSVHVSIIAQGHRLFFNLHLHFAYCRFPVFFTRWVGPG
jgi:hypothetical protein